MMFGNRGQVDPEARTIVDGKLYLNYDKTARDGWRQDPVANIAAADDEYPLGGSRCGPRSRRRSRAIGQMPVIPTDLLLWVRPQEHPAVTEQWQKHRWAMASGRDASYIQGVETTTRGRSSSMSLLEHVGSLRVKKSQIEDLIEQEQHRPLPDQSILTRLKREKLKIKEQINRLDMHMSTSNGVSPTLQ
jgi:hypothetical protein